MQIHPIQPGKHGYSFVPLDLLQLARGGQENTFGPKVLNNALPDDKWPTTKTKGTLLIIDNIPFSRMHQLLGYC